MQHELTNGSYPHISYHKAGDGTEEHHGFEGVTNKYLSAVVPRLFELIVPRTIRIFEPSASLHPVGILLSPS